MSAFKWVSVFLLVCAAHLTSAQTVDPFYSGTYTLINLGSVAGVPTNYGGLVFKAGDPNTIILGGAANTAAGLFYSVPVTRGAGNHIVSFGIPTALGFGINNDGGIAYGPGGVLFYSEYPINNVGEVKPGSNVDNKTVALGPIGIPASTGALNFVPPGYNGAGQFKVSSWPNGQFFTVPLASDGTGTFNLASATLQVTLPGGPEGFVYVPLGSALFPSQSMLVSEYSGNTVATYTIDANGNPVLASRQVFIANLTGAEGAAIDPVTGDFFFSTFGGSNQIIEVRGFTAPSLAVTTTVVGAAPNPSIVGQSVTLTATVTGNNPTGTVQFQDGAVNLGGPVPLAGGSASLITSTLTQGTHSITAVYSGDPSNATSTSSPLIQTVNAVIISVPSQSIPTLSSWMIILFAGLLGALGVWRIRSGVRKAD